MKPAGTWAADLAPGRQLDLAQKLNFLALSVSQKAVQESKIYVMTTHIYNCYVAGLSPTGC